MLVFRGVTSFFVTRNPTRNHALEKEFALNTVNLNQVLGSEYSTCIDFFPAHCIFEKKSCTSS